MFLVFASLNNGFKVIYMLMSAEKPQRLVLIPIQKAPGVAEWGTVAGWLEILHNNH